MQTTGYLVGVIVKLTACVKFSHDNFSGGALEFVIFFDIGRNASTVIDHTDGIIRMNSDGDLITVTRQRLVNRVINHLKNHVMKPGAITGVTDVHAGAFSYRFKTLEYLDTVGVVFFAGLNLFLIGH